jgi:hypothetical protein
VPNNSKNIEPKPVKQLNKPVAVKIGAVDEKRKKERK